MNFWSHMHMLPLLKNKISNVKKIRKKYAHIYLHILRGHAKFRKKLIFFVPYAKKTKTYVTKGPILVTNFIIFT
jgi:hypothetical protein